MVLGPVLLTLGTLPGHLQTSGDSIPDPQWTVRFQEILFNLRGASQSITDSRWPLEVEAQSLTQRVHQKGKLVTK